MELAIDQLPVASRVFALALQRSWVHIPLKNDFFATACIAVYMFNCGLRAVSLSLRFVRGAKPSVLQPKQESPG